MMRIGFSDDWVPHEFWEYTTVVLDRFFEMEPPWDANGDAARAEMSHFEDELIRRFNNAGIRCIRDYRIAFALKHKTNGMVIFIGFYDGRLCIGSRVRSSYPKPISKTL